MLSCQECMLFFEDVQRGIVKVKNIKIGRYLSLPGHSDAKDSRFDLPSKRREMFKTFCFYDLLLYFFPDKSVPGGQFLLTGEPIGLECPIYL